MKNHKHLIFTNIMALIAVLTVNYLSNALSLNGNTPAQLSDLYVNLFVPSGRTFAIWGVIYTWLIVWGGYQIAALFSEKTLTKLHASLQAIGYLFVITCLLNISWLLAWHWQYLWVSVVIMLGLLATLLQIDQRLYANQRTASAIEKWLVKAPFGIYLGWISVATIANFTAVLVAMHWNGAELFLTITMVSVGGLLAVFMTANRKNIFYGLAVAWALFGIYSKRQVVGGEPSIMVARVAIGFCVLLLGLALYNLVKKTNQ